MFWGLNIVLLQLSGRDILVKECHQCQFLLLSSRSMFITIMILIMIMVVTVVVMVTMVMIVVIMVVMVMAIIVTMTVVAHISKCYWAQGHH